MLIDEAHHAFRLGDVPTAERLARRGLEKTPDDVQALALLAEIMLAKGAIGVSIALLRRALNLAPSEHHLRVNLAALHQQQGQYPAGLAQIQRVPPPVRAGREVAVIEAALLGRLGRREPEIAIYRRLLGEQPEDATLWGLQGYALNYAGHGDEAITAFRRAIALRPSAGEAWWGLANMKSLRFDDSDVEAMEAALSGGVSTEEAIHFRFALGSAYEQRKAYRRSFDHYEAGNCQRASTLDPQQEGVVQRVDESISAFNKDLFARNHTVGASNCDPIFVVGLQRAGSTLIEQILASHPEIEGTGELLAMPHLWDELVQQAARDNCSLGEMIVRLEPADFARIGAQYLRRTQMFRQAGKPRFVDKLPANWLHIGLIRLALPNARIIDARRHPMACGFSNFKQLYAGGVDFAYALDTIGLTYRNYLRLMRHFDAVQPNAVLRVVNEQLIEQPEAEVRRLLDFIGLAFDPACLDFYRTDRPVNTPSAAQVRRPINRAGVDQWRHYQAWLGPLERALGDALDDWQD